MVKVSIFSLIFKSPAYADFIWNAIHDNTPELKSVFLPTEFYFVVNYTKDFGDKILEHLDRRGYKYFVYDKEPDQPKYPENIGAIYRAWNFGVGKANGEYVVLLNSDMYPASSRWLRDCLDWLQFFNGKAMITPRLIERGKMPSGQWGVTKDFGITIKDFRKTDFKIYANSISENKYEEGGLFMPVLMDKHAFLESGGYPEGNVGGVSGDKLFFDKMVQKGYKHITPFNVIFYHYQEGETDAGN